MPDHVAVRKLISVGFSVALAATSCGSAPSPNHAARTGSLPTSSASPSSLSTAPAAPAAPISPNAGAADARQTVSTEGNIACATTHCRAPDERCIQEGKAPPHCVPASTPGSENAPVSYACDDSSDCSDGFACCAAPESPAGRTRCIQPDVADGEACILQACVIGGGAPCPKTQTCRAGFCRATVHERATCEGSAGGSHSRAPCPADMPGCAWKDGKASCSAADADSSYACTRKSDCGEDLFCCSVSEAPTGQPAPRSACLRTCEAPLAPALCATNADCPMVLATGSNGGMRQTKCVAHDKEADEPAWLKHCAVP